jgi:hypothetical protein
LSSGRLFDAIEIVPEASRYEPDAAESDIRDLIAHYNRALDDGRPEAAASLFVPDGTLRAMGQIFRGWSAILATFRESRTAPIDGPITAHHTSNVIVTFENEGPEPGLIFPFFAAAESDFYVLRARGATQLEIAAAGRYRDRLRNTANGWRFEDREVVALSRFQSTNSPDS